MYKSPLARSFTCDVLEQRALLAPVDSCHPLTAINGFTIDALTTASVECTFEGVDASAGKLIMGSADFQLKSLSNGQAQIGIGVLLYATSAPSAFSDATVCSTPVIWTEPFNIPSGFCIHNTSPRSDGSVDSNPYLTLDLAEAGILTQVATLSNVLDVGTVATTTINLSQLQLKFEDNGSFPTSMDNALSSALGIQSTGTSPFSASFTDSSSVTYTGAFFSNIVPAEDLATALNPCRDTDCFNAADQAALIEAMLNYKPWAR